MKEVWVKVDPWKKELVTTALESGADAVVVPGDKVATVRGLGLIKTVSDEGDLKWGEDVVTVDIKSAGDEEQIVKLSRHKKVVVRTMDWSIIPLENLVARTSNIFVEANDLEEARTAAGILEKGVDGLIITHRSPARVREIITEIKSGQQELGLEKLRVNRVRPVGMGDRVCVDTCTMMGSGEGILVGNSSQALFLVHAESIENPYVAPRPFRVNAGPVHAYVLVPEGRTRYLSELKAGDEVVRINSTGHVMSLVVGRVKIERRPLLLIEAMAPNGPATTILQNAETIRLVRPDGEAASVLRLMPGDEVLGFVEEAGRHFGHKVTETITEQ
jgi:3-dehydroquinate synthase II